MSAKPKSPRRSRNGKPSGRPPRSWKVLLACLFLAGFLVACLVFLARLSPVRPPSSPPTPVVTERPGGEAVIAVVENVLLKSGVSPDRMKTSKDEFPFVLDVQGDVPSIPVLEVLESRLRKLHRDLILERSSLASLLVRDRSRRYLLIRFEADAAPVPQAPERDRLAIIMDDLGRDLKTVERLLEIEVPITFAILPGEKNAGSAAKLVHRHGREVMIHIPMEPQSYPATNPGRDALFVGMSRAEIQQRFHGFLERVPYAVGGNNHMGSRFTEDRVGMEALLEVIKQKGMFFVDSRTTGGSVAADEARNMRVPVLERDVFLDNQPDVASISSQIRFLVAKAKRQGQAVGICHPYPETIQALQEMSGYFGREGVEVVPISKLLAR